ncbi:MAG: Cas10/Cmr2 second palm domain-containing protein [Gammaproteobacteria bacterium]
MDQHHAYLFEAHSIQRYILDSGKLGDMIGASELVESLTTKGGLLDQALEKLALEQPTFSRRAGGAFTAFFKSHEEASKLRDLWGLLIQQYAPGLGFSHAVVSDETQIRAITRGRKTLAEQRHQALAAHPPASPVTRRSPRTGLPATDTGTDFDDTGEPGAVREWVDRASHMKSAGRFRKSRALAARFGSHEGLRWPTLLDPADANDPKITHDAFPFLPDNRYVGVLHADGNDLGKLLATLEKNCESHEGNTYQTVFNEFSGAVAHATQAAAQEAGAVLSAALEQEGRDGDKARPEIYPARPLVLGGDDLTIIVRADCALDYAESFIQAFEEHSRTAFAKLKSGPLAEAFSPLPESGMTACAGIAFIKSTQPFYLAYELAEGLCDHAKKTSRDEKGTKHPALAFARVTTSFIPRYEDLLDAELSLRDGNEITHRMTLGAYAIGRENLTDLPPFTGLRTLKKLLAKPGMSRGPARRLLGLLHHDPDDAQRAYERWKHNLKDADRTSETQRLDEFQNALETLGVDRDAPLPYRKRNIPDTPLGDALAWLAVDGSMEANDDD